MLKSLMSMVKLNKKTATIFDSFREKPNCVELDFGSAVY